MKHKDLNEKQKEMATLFFWACYFNKNELAEKFVAISGVSPFIKLYQRQNAVKACILGENYILLEEFIKDTNREVLTTMDQKDKRYSMKECKWNDIDYFWKSRENKDEFGNNVMHAVFLIEDVELRNKFITLLLNEQVGNVDKRNKLGFLP